MIHQLNMGVYIKGMKMPKSWYDCQFAVDGMCVAMQPISTRNWREKETTNLCPLVPIPDHGDLIDRDALMTSLGMAMDCDGCPNRTMLNFCGLPTEVMEVCDELENAPVVIPAERSE